MHLHLHFAAPHTVWWWYRYAGGVQSRAAASGLKLVAKAKASKPAAKPKVTVPAILPEEEARQRRLKQLEQQARDKKAAEAAAKEKDAQRQWILQYAEEDSESDSNDDQKEQVSHTSFLHHCVPSPVLFVAVGTLLNVCLELTVVSCVVWGRNCGNAGRGGY